MLTGVHSPETVAITQDNIFCSILAGFLFLLGGRIHVSEQTKELIIPGREEGYVTRFRLSRYEEQTTDGMHGVIRGSTSCSVHSINDFVCYVTCRDPCNKTEATGSSEVSDKIS